MKWYQGISYYLIVIAINVILGLITYYLIPFLVSLFIYNELINLILIVGIIVILNPIITFKLSQKIPFEVKDLIKDQDEELDLE